MSEFVINIEGVAFPKGNFAALHMTDLDSGILKKCMKAERKFRTDYASCVNSIRSAFEAFGFEIEYKKRIQTDESLAALSHDEGVKKVRDEINTINRNNRNKKGYPITFKDLLKADLLDNKRNEDLAFNRYCRLFNIVRWEKPTKNFSSLKDAFYDLYARTSGNVHDAAATEQQARFCIMGLYAIFSAYYDLAEFDFNLCGYEDYYPIPKKLYKNLCLLDEEGLDIFVREEQNRLAFYLLKNNEADKALYLSRDIDIVRRLWMDSQDSPNNVLQLRETIGTPEYARQVFAFSGRPYMVNEALLNHLSDLEKDALVGGMLKAVYSLHDMESPLAHRTLNPYSFYACKNQDRWKAVLMRFDSVKDIQMGDAGTVYGQINKIRDNTWKRTFLAPELEANQTIGSYKAADIYSLGKILQFIYLGEISRDMKRGRVDHDLIKLINRMTESNPTRRLNICEVWEQFSLRHIHRPIYLICSKKGKRKIQQDAFCYNGEEKTFGDDIRISGTSTIPALFGVFDGVSQGDCGEEMSQLAAKELMCAFRGKLDTEMAKYNKELEKAIEHVQLKACEWIENNDYYGSGTTFAAAVVGRDQAFVANVGDSRVYLWHKNQLRQLTVDHLYDNSGKLYQWIGMPEEDCSIEADQCRCDLADEDILMLCTDGLTRYVPEEEIKECFQLVVFGEEELGQIADELLEKAGKYCSKDDISIILYTRGV